MREDLARAEKILYFQFIPVFRSLQNAGDKLSDTNPHSILASLQQKIKKDFPKAAKTEITIKYVDKEMEEYLSPAFYMIPAIDDTKNNTIYLNRGHLPDDLSLYTTLAHEGYPGHLYQTTYFAARKPDPIRTIFSFGGYTEGWATYCEMLSYYYAPVDKTYAAMAAKKYFSHFRSLQPCRHRYPPRRMGTFGDNNIFPEPRHYRHRFHPGNL